MPMISAVKHVEKDIYTVKNKVCQQTKIVAIITFFASWWAYCDMWSVSDTHEVSMSHFIFYSVYSYQPLRPSNYM